jgi:ribosomal protein S18 acetylase RimI-like enzyme
MNNHITITAAKAVDIPTIQQIAYTTWPVAYADILSQQQLTYMLDMMYNETILLQQLKDGHQFLLAQQDKDYIGFAGFSSTEEEHKFKLHKLYVLPNQQQHGAGKKLLQQVIAAAQSAGGKQLILQVNRHNKAKQFYERLGFTVLYEKAFDIGNGYIMDDYVMGLEL